MMARVTRLGGSTPSGRKKPIMKNAMKRIVISGTPRKSSM